MAGEWRDIPFTEAIILNPPTTLKRGASFPFVEMADVNANCRCTYANVMREFKGGGSRFVVGDTLMARITPCLENGKIARFCGKPDQAAFGSTEFMVIRGRDGVSDTAYVYYLTQWDGVKGYAIAQMTGTSGRQRVATRALDNLYIRLPPLPEQRAIAHILGTLDDKIELNQRMSATCEAMTRALFKDWFVDFGPTRAKMQGRDPDLPPDLAALFPNRLVETEHGQVPEGWEVSMIGNEVQVVGGSTPSTKDPSFWDGKISWATPKDLSSLEGPVLLETSRRITPAGLTKIGSGLLPIGTILLSSRAPIGYLAIPEVPVAVNQGFVAMVCEGRVSNVFAWLWSQANMKAIIQNANGSTFQEISKSNFRTLPMIVSTDDVLEAFNGPIRHLHRRIVSCERETRTLAALRDTLLPKLISGELRVKDAESLLDRVP